MTPEEIRAIADGWIKEFSVEPYVLQQREMDAWFKLDYLIYNHPQDALRVLEEVAKRDLIDWTFEGIAVGPIRTFLMLHGDRYDGELSAIRGRNKVFDGMYAMAVQGL